MKTTVLSNGSTWVLYIALITKVVVRGACPSISKQINFVA